MDCIAQLEKDVSFPSDNRDALGLQGALVRVLPGSTSLPSPPYLKKTIRPRVCEMICAYRLIDILYDLQELKAPSSYERPIYPKQRLHKFLPTRVKS
jgi:hypothetical protein